MNHFLNRLAARSLSPNAAIQPRLASRYEPDLHPPATDEAESVERETNARTAEEPRSPKAPRIEIPENESSILTSFRPTPISDRPPAENIPETPILSLRSPSMEATRESPSEGGTSPKAAPPNVLFPEIRRLGTSEKNGPTVHNHFSEAPANRPATIAGTPPIIHVTIGRVEVRAVLPAPVPAQRSSPSASKVSLQEHLQNGGRK